MILEVTIFGFETTGTYGKRLTGPHHLKKGRIAAGELVALSLNDFTKGTGERWVSMTMRVEDVELKASVGGEACSGSVKPTAPMMEVIGR